MKYRFENLVLPKMAAISGVMKSATNAVTTAAKATPTTTATARSTTFPRNTNFLKSDSMVASQLAFHGGTPTREEGAPHTCQTDRPRVSDKTR